MSGASPPEAVQRQLDAEGPVSVEMLCLYDIDGHVIGTQQIRFGVGPLRVRALRRQA